MAEWRKAFRDVEAVVLSTCNRMEVYAASQSGSVPNLEQIGDFLARFHRRNRKEIVPHLFVSSNEEAVRHLFDVAASLDSMVLGEPQILAQVKLAYEVAVECEATGPLLHQAFQAGNSRWPPRSHRNRHPSAQGQYSQRRRGRFREANLRVLRRQGNARHRSRRNGEETLRYLHDEGGAADHHRQSQL